MARAIHTAALLMLAILIEAARFAPAAEQPISRDPDGWAEKLGSADFDERAEAAGKLAEQGEAARIPLEKALASSDPETRATAARLLGLLSHCGVRVMAFDRNGKPADGIEAALNVWDNSNRYQTNNRVFPPLKTGADGSAETVGLKRGTCTFNLTWQKCWIAGDPAFSGNAFSSLIAGVRGGTMPLLFSVSKGGSVACLVCDKDGKPLKDAEFTLYAPATFNADLLDLRPENQSIRPIASATSDAAGHALIESVADGVYICAASWNGGIPVEGATVRVREGTTTRAPKITVSATQPGKCTFTLHGIVETKTPDALETALKTARKPKEGDAPGKNKPNGDPAKEPQTEKSPELLKNAKMSVEDDFIYPGTDDRKQRKMAAEKMRFNRFRQRPLTETDENGAITLDNMRAGKHRIEIRCQGYAPRVVTVDIPAGGKADAGDVVLDAGGTIAFKAHAANGKAISDVTAFPIPEDDSAFSDLPSEVLGFLRGQNTFEEARNIMTFQHQFQLRRQSSVAEEPERITVKNLSPGTYSLVVFRQMPTRVQQVYLICGISVALGKTVELAPLAFPTFVAQSRPTDSTFIKGKVTGAPGEVMARAPIYYQMAGGNTGTNLNADGTFQIHNGGLGAGGIIRVKVSGYKQAEFDCSARGADLNNIVIKLEKLKYGDLSLRIVDEEGKPLAGASIDPAPNPNFGYNYNYYRGLVFKKKFSDARGVVRLQGLSVGLRRITVQRDGYYLADPVRVSILPDSETRVEVMMRRGLTVSGKLNAPEGMSLTQAVVTLKRVRDSALFTTGVRAAGDFSIEAMAPDSYLLSAEAPLLRASAVQEIELIGEAKTNLTIAMVKSGGFAVQVDPALKGRMLFLYDKVDLERGATKPGATPVHAALSCIDADGKAEFWGVKPGTYRVAAPVGHRDSKGTADSDEKYAGRIECNCFSEPFEIKEPKLFSELNLDDAPKLIFPDTSGSAVVKFVIRKSALDANPRAGMGTTSMTISIKGEQCAGQYNFNQRPRYQTATVATGISTTRLRVIGSRPAFLAPRPVNGAMLINGLVPGKYRIIATAFSYDAMRSQMQRTKEAVAAEFEIKAGERKELGPVIIEPSTEFVDAGVARRAAPASDPPPEEDRDPAFEP